MRVQFSALSSALLLNHTLAAPQVATTPLTNAANPGNNAGAGSNNEPNLLSDIIAPAAPGSVSLGTTKLPNYSTYKLADLVKTAEPFNKDDALKFPPSAPPPKAYQLGPSANLIIFFAEAPPQEFNKDGAIAMVKTIGFVQSAAVAALTNSTSLPTIPFNLNTPAASSSDGAGSKPFEAKAKAKYGTMSADVELVSSPSSEEVCDPQLALEALGLWESMVVRQGVRGVMYFVAEGTLEEDGAKEEHRGACTFYTSVLPVKEGEGDVASF